MTLRAPIDSADVLVSDDVALALGVRIDKVSAGNFLLDAALRGFLLSHRAHELLFEGRGQRDSDRVELGGVAKAGQVSVAFTLGLTEISSGAAFLVLGVTGTAVFTDDDVPIPGIGRLDHLELAVSTQLDLIPEQ